MRHRHLFFIGAVVALGFLVTMNGVRDRRRLTVLGGSYHPFLQRYGHIDTNDSSAAESFGNTTTSIAEQTVPTARTYPTSQLQQPRTVGMAGTSETMQNPRNAFGRRNSVDAATMLRTGSTPQNALGSSPEPRVAAQGTYSVLQQPVALTPMTSGLATSQQAAAQQATNLPPKQTSTPYGFRQPYRELERSPQKPLLSQTYTTQLFQHQLGLLHPSRTSLNPVGSAPHLGPASSSSSTTTTVASTLRALPFTTTAPYDSLSALTAEATGKHEGQRQDKALLDTEDSSDDDSASSLNSEESTEQKDASFATGDENILQAALRLQIAELEAHIQEAKEKEKSPGEKSTPEEEPLEEMKEATAAPAQSVAEEQTEKQQGEELPGGIQEEADEQAASSSDTEETKPIIMEKSEFNSDSESAQENDKRLQEARTAYYKRRKAMTEMGLRKKKKGLLEGN